MVAVEHESDSAGLVRKAVNLFTFLGRTQQLLVKPVRTVDKFEKVLGLVICRNTWRCTPQIERQTPMRIHPCWRWIGCPSLIRPLCRSF